MIPPSGYLRRVIFTFMLVAIPMSLVLLFTYDVIKIYWNPGMVIQISIGYQEAPRQMGAERSHPGRRARPSRRTSAQAVNPVPADATSLQRGAAALRAQLRAVPRRGRPGRRADHAVLEG